ncbi:MAG TPA: heme exporter protein CcmB, partial [Rhodothermales bacterium]|nr:heme exporter protein CcmB [Rhodothermales bacterium]
YAINMLLMFVLSALLLVIFAIGQEPVSDRVQAALLWIVILFSAAIGLGRAFIAEEERGTVLLLQLNTRASMVYAGKLLFNFLLVLGLNVVAVGAFLLLLNVEVRLPGLLLTTLVLGALGLSGATTLLAAIIARTANRGPLLPVLLFPLLIPLLLSVVSATKSALPNGLGWAAASDEMLTLVGFAGVVITASVLLFDYVWND